jgi:hypothetical protein
VADTRPIPPRLPDARRDRAPARRVGQDRVAQSCRRLSGPCQPVHSCLAGSALPLPVPPAVLRCRGRLRTRPCVAGRLVEQRGRQLALRVPQQERSRQPEQEHRVSGGGVHILRAGCPCRNCPAAMASGPRRRMAEPVPGRVLLRGRPEKYQPPRALGLCPGAGPRFGERPARATDDTDGERPAAPRATAARIPMRVSPPPSVKSVKPGKSVA